MAQNLNPPALYGIYKQIDPYLASMRIGGVVGDARHVNAGSYHVSRQVMRAHGMTGHYSMKAPADLRGPDEYASAIDITLNSAEMVEVSRRLDDAMRKDDPRIEPCREYIGTFNGRDVCGYNRYDSGGTGSRSVVGHHSSGYGDKGHLWHVHISIFRCYANDKNRMTGVAEVVAGLVAGKLGWSNPGGGDAPAPTKAPTKAVEPAKPKAKISLKAAQTGMRTSGKGPASTEVKLIQAALGVSVTGHYDDKSRAAGAKYQVKISDPPKPTPWPETGWDAGDGKKDGTGDADGILGVQSLTALGFDVQP